MTIYTLLVFLASTFAVHCNFKSHNKAGMVLTVLSVLFAGMALLIPSLQANIYLIGIIACLMYLYGIYNLNSVDNRVSFLYIIASGVLLFSVN